MAAAPRHPESVRVTGPAASRHRQSAVTVESRQKGTAAPQARGRAEVRAGLRTRGGIEPASQSKSQRPEPRAGSQPSRTTTSRIGSPRQVIATTVRQSAASPSRRAAEDRAGESRQRPGLPSQQRLSPSRRSRDQPPLRASPQSPQSRDQPEGTTRPAPGLPGRCRAERGGRPGDRARARARVAGALWRTGIRAQRSAKSDCGQSDQPAATGDEPNRGALSRQRPVSRDSEPSRAEPSPCQRDPT